MHLYIASDDLYQKIESEAVFSLCSISVNACMWSQNDIATLVDCLPWVCLERVTEDDHLLYALGKLPSGGEGSGTAAGGAIAKPAPSNEEKLQSKQMRTYTYTIV